ncbi:hypothetical protein EDB92DRAFT_1816825 [Lactarius akahatsu]|uniref:Uncharacterized protein n=1 Tax=Lactarius akahatsu TaxID=416441 RepID=A0AAD4Q7E4_9AGAM|nr:hypothetical protein EDB92DRAFT_1816825 [Lactarius akahatsu]
MHINVNESALVLSPDEPYTLSPPLSSSTSQPEVLWHDDNFTVYREKTDPVSSKGHIVVRQLAPHTCLSLVLMTKLTSFHVPSIYVLRSSPPHFPPRHGHQTTHLSPPYGLVSLFADVRWATEHRLHPALYPPIQFSHRLHFPRLADPVTDHLHAHAFISPASTAYRRPHCRDTRIGIKQPRQVWIRIDLVPDAGARVGTANGRETTLASPAIEEGQTLREQERG